MKRREVKKMLQNHPKFAQWVRQDASRIREIRSNPAAATRLFSKWQQVQTKRNFPVVDFERLSTHTRRMSEVLSNVQSVMDVMAEYVKNRPKE